MVGLCPIVEDAARTAGSPGEKKNMAVPLPGRFAGAFLPVPASLEAGRCHGRADCRLQIRGIVWRRGEENPIWWKGFPPCETAFPAFVSSC